VQASVVGFGGLVDGGEVGAVVGDQDGGGGVLVGEAGDEVEDGGAAFVVGALVGSSTRRTVGSFIRARAMVMGRRASAFVRPASMEEGRKLQRINKPLR
jgi:hypothetical protein